MISSSVETVAQGRPHVQRQLLQLPPRHKRGQGDAATGLAVESRSRPDLTPRVARYEVLEVGGERRRSLHRGIDVLVAQEPPCVPPCRARGQNRPRSCPLPHGAACRCSSIAPVIASGLSTLARCAAGESTVEARVGHRVADRLRPIRRRGGVLRPGDDRAWGRACRQASLPGRQRRSPRNTPRSPPVGYRATSALPTRRRPGGPREKLGVNQRSSTASATSATPCSRTVRAREL